jgi:glycosyltransferase involved in cell wall biosynthesis
VRTPLIVVSGKHPIREIGGFGHSAYVRAHAMAAHRAGFDPQMFCVGDRDTLEETTFGTIHQVRSLRPYRQNAIPIHGPVLARAIERFVLAHGPASPVGLHGFGVWTYAIVLAARALAARGIATATIGSSYTTYVDERRAMADGIESHQPFARRLGPYGDLLWSPIVARYERAAYRGVNLVTVNYQSVARMIARRCGPDVRVRIGRYSTPLAFEPDAKAPPSRDPGAPIVFVTISGHFERKGMDVFIRAMKRLLEGGTPARAMCVGGGTLLEAHRALVRELGLANAIEMCGVVDSVEPYLAGGDAFVLPSRSEQSGSLAVIEAMRAGLPVIASACDGVPEDLAMPDSGVLVEPGSAEALAGALERFTRDAELRARYGAGARAAFEARFSAESFSLDLAQAYREAGIVADASA